ncbi:YrhK family protein [Acidithiobacillus sp.]|uniref:YrhK family protein n=1 Tax=Acidithiobacillus sp. TaxID=1872118 RepID=UPI0025C2CC0F|nr:YrhK family protein [Acidithiobacillus sp.]
MHTHNRYGEVNIMTKQQQPRHLEVDGTGLCLTMGGDELVIRNRYETAATANDLLIGILFLVGSCFFFYPAMEYSGVWLFVIGSAGLLIRPMIRLARNVHIQSLRQQSTTVPRGAEAELLTVDD